LQTFVEQKLDFLLREYFGLAVPFYLHAWCIPDPISESLSHLLRYCIRRRGFLNVVARGAKGNKGHRRFGERQSLLGILKINDVGKFIKNTARMIVRDRQGREYRLQVDPDEDQYFTAKLLYRNSAIGMLQCVLYPPDKLVIGDILIRDDVIHTPEHLGVALLRLLVEPKPIDYRHRGLGTHLLQFAIKKAHERGIKRICVSLTQEDINNNPNLVK